MAEIRLNKTELKKQKTLLAQLSKYLPTLQLKKQQLQVEVENVKTVYNDLEKKLLKLKETLLSWSLLLSQKLTVDIMDSVKVDKLLTTTENIAGIDVPKFEEIVFCEFDYSYFLTPIWFEKAKKELRDLVVFRERMKITTKRLELIGEELRQTNIKVNLFEKRMIPNCKENIKRIKIFLGDQEIAAICNAKIAKDKLKKKEQLELEAAI